jgi:hypothetical protein
MIQLLTVIKAAGLSSQALSPPTLQSEAASLRRLRCPVRWSTPWDRDGCSRNRRASSTSLCQRCPQDVSGRARITATAAPAITLVLSRKVGVLGAEPGHEIPAHAGRLDTRSPRSAIPRRGRADGKHQAPRANDCRSGTWLAWRWVLDRRDTLEASDSGPCSKWGPRAQAILKIARGGSSSWVRIPRPPLQGLSAPDLRGS